MRDIRCLFQMRTGLYRSDVSSFYPWNPIQKSGHLLQRPIGREVDGTGVYEYSGRFALIEGVMGYHAMVGRCFLQGSSYEPSVQTKTPVLQVNGRGMSLSMMALIRGFMDMYSDSDDPGAIMNRVSKAVCDRLTPLIEKQLGIAVIGWCLKQR